MPTVQKKTRADRQPMGMTRCRSGYRKASVMMLPPNAQRRPPRRDCLEKGSSLTACSSCHSDFSPAPAGLLSECKPPHCLRAMVQLCDRNSRHLLTPALSWLDPVLRAAVFTETKAVACRYSWAIFTRRDRSAGVSALRKQGLSTRGQVDSKCLGGLPRHLALEVGFAAVN